MPIRAPRARAPGDDQGVRDDKPLGEIAWFHRGAPAGDVEEAGQLGLSTPLRTGRDLIPFIAQLEAITKAGKTPMLASIFNGLGPGMMFWPTSRDGPGRLGLSGDLNDVDPQTHGGGSAIGAWRI